MDLILDDSIYARFQTWKLKCENSLDAELASFPDARNYMILLRWLGDQGLEMFQAMCVESSKVSTAILWSKLEDFCKPHANELS